MVLYHKKRRPVEPVPEAPRVDLSDSARVIVKFADAANRDVGDDIELSMATTVDEMKAILKTYLSEEERLQDFSLVLADSGLEIMTDVRTTFTEAAAKDIVISTEETLRIAYYSKAPFRVRPVTRLAGSLKGHRGTIICAAFSPNSDCLATGSGDCTVRLWDLLSSTPLCTLRGHTAPVVSIAWSADCKWLASGSEDHTIRVWHAAECNATNQPDPIVLKLHTDTVTCVEFLPAHLHAFWRQGTPLLLSAARNGGAKIWDVKRGEVVSHLDGHTKMITSARWSGLMTGSFEDPRSADAHCCEVQGPFVYTASRDMTVRVWHALDGRLLANVRCHGHWVNSLSCNTDGLMRAGPFDHTGIARYYESFEAMAAAAEANWKRAWPDLGEERIVTSSDDNTLCLWNLMRGVTGGKYEPLARMTGHQKAVCCANFSPNGRYIVSAGFDSAIRLWDGRTGKFLHTFRGHVGAVYQVSWAADSRLFVSCSRDSTLKVWDTIEGGRRLKEDLPGAADEIYAVQWSIDCSRVASGGRDRVLRLWSY